MTAPPSKNEQIKEASRFLRGGIADGLAKVETGAIAEDDAQLTKFHGTYLQDDRDLRPERRKKKLEQAYSFMIRVRVPGGVCTPAQWLAIDRIATDYANGTLRLTTRQAFQFHGVIKSNLKRSMQAINDALLDTVAACGDVNRNVMCNPNPYQSKAHAAALELARAISDHLTPQNRCLSRDLAGRREGGRHAERRGADLRPALPAAQVQDRGRGAAVQRRRHLRAATWASSPSSAKATSWSATTSRSAAAWA